MEPGSLIHIDYYARPDKAQVVSLKEAHVEERFEILKSKYMPSLLLAYLLELYNAAATYAGDEDKETNTLGTSQDLKSMKNSLSHSLSCPSSKIFVLLHGSIAQLCRFL